MADEQITLEALEREAEEALKAEEGAPTPESEEAAQGAAEEGAEEAQVESAAPEQAGARVKKMVEVPEHKLAKLRESRREEREQKERLQRQNEELLQQLALLGGQKKQDPMAVPTLESCEFDEAKYTQKLSEWHTQNLERQLAEVEQKRLDEQRKQLFAQQLEQSTNEHYQRVISSGIDVDEFYPAEKALRDQFGELAVDQMIDALGEGSEKVVYHLGLNQSERDKVAQMVRQDPSGLKAMTYLGKLAAKLSAEPAQKKISQAPAVDKPLAGSTGSTSTSSVLKRLAMLDKNPNRDAFREYKRKLVAAGQSELLRQNGYM